MDAALAGLADAMTLGNLLWVLAGVVLGQFVGAVPGLNAPMAIAIAVPFTYALNPLAAIAFLVGINKGGTVGGAVPAILINTPGSADSAATALDGHPMAVAGQPRKALKLALFSSITGDTFSDIVLITVSTSLAVLALRAGPAEVMALMIFALAIIPGLVGGSMVRGLAAAFLGLLLSTVGLDQASGTPRLTFGMIDLYDGLPLAAVAVGVLAVGEIFRQIFAMRPPPRTAGDDGQAGAIASGAGEADQQLTLREFVALRVTLLRGAVIGTLVGAVPGAGSSAAAFLSYAEAKRRSPTPERFGKGAPEGVAATESANSAVVGSNMIPLLSLGIPGNVTAALILGAFIIHGIQPGPLLFQEQAQLVYALFGAMIMANGMNLVVGLVGLRFWTVVVRAPATLIYPVAFLFCIVGTHVVTNSMLGVAIMLCFGVLGLLMRLFDFSVVPFIIAFFIGPNFELAVIQFLVVSGGDPAFLLGRPVALALLVLSVLALWHFGFRAHPAKKSGDGAD
ncbi:MAG: tripartite tricarboxylate transporter permease [Pararhodobacter sp.]|nr:tripartite tricarboxylate transporter permease [Pararhodobacter sp.]